MKIKKDDTVIVLAGKDKGKTGKVLKAMPKDNKVIVEGVNIQTKHQKQTQKAAAEIKHQEGPILRSSTRKARSMHQTSCSMTQRQRSRQESDTRSKTARRSELRKQPEQKLTKKGGDGFDSKIERKV